MCCLFGIIDCFPRFSGSQKTRLLRILAQECEARGTDATGIAYNHKGRLTIFKRPLPAHRLRFYIPDGVRMVMGHTRMTTQGCEKRNYNNHPFKGLLQGRPFALAHNGGLHNDRILRKTLSLPKTGIETDSFIGVQLIEQRQALDFDSLRYMAEQVEGSFAFTVLDSQENLYFVKGDNPLCLYSFPRLGFYLYASTEVILKRAVQRIGLKNEAIESVPIRCGDILRLSGLGKMERSEFDTTALFHEYYPRFPLYQPFMPRCEELDEDYMRKLQSVASSFGYTPEDVKHLLSLGLTTDEIEEMLYSGEL